MLAIQKLSYEERKEMAPALALVYEALQWVMDSNNTSGDNSSEWLGKNDRIEVKIDAKKSSY